MDGMPKAKGAAETRVNKKPALTLDSLGIDKNLAHATASENATMSHVSKSSYRNPRRHTSSSLARRPVPTLLNPPTKNAYLLRRRVVVETAIGGGINKSQWLFGGRHSVMQQNTRRSVEAR